MNKDEQSKKNDNWAIYLYILPVGASTFAYGCYLGLAKQLGEILNSQDNFWWSYVLGYISKPFFILALSRLNIPNRQSTVLFLGPVIMGLATISLPIVFYCNFSEQTTFYLFTLIRILQSAAVSMVFPSSLTLLQDNTPKESRAFNNSLLNTLAGIGTLSSLFLGISSGIIGRIDWSWVAIFAALLNFVSAGLRWWLKDNISFEDDNVNAPIPIFPPSLQKAPKLEIFYILLVNAALAFYPHLTNTWWRLNAPFFGLAIDNPINLINFNYSSLVGKTIAVCYRPICGKVSQQYGVETVAVYSLITALTTLPIFYMCSISGLTLLLYFGQIMVGIIAGFITSSINHVLHDHYEHIDSDSLNIGYLWHFSNGLVSIPLVAVASTLLNIKSRELYLAVLVIVLLASILAINRLNKIKINREKL